MIFNELKHIFGRKLLMFILVILALIPAIYTGFFLDSMWKPYQSIDKLPVAVVNNDRGDTVEGEKINVGEELVRNMREKKTLDFHFVKDRQTGVDGLRDGRYYMVLVLDEDFSANAGKILKNTPLPMRMDYVVNPGMNYISTKITDAAVKDIQKEIVRSVQDTYLGLLFKNMDKMRLGYTSIREGTTEINHAVSDLYDGQKDLNEGLRTLNEKSGTLAEGADTLQSGLGRYIGGVNALRDGASTLDAGGASLRQGSSKLFDGISGGLTPMIDGSGKMADGLNRMREALPTSEDLTRLNAGWQEVDGHLSTLSSGTGQTLAALQQLDAGLASLKTGTQGLADGTAGIDTALMQQGLRATLAQYVPADKLDEATQAVAGILNPQMLEQLKQGAKQVNDGAAQLQQLSAGILNGPDGTSGLTALSDGLSKLSAGHATLTENQIKLNNGYESLRSGLSGPEGLSAGAQRLQGGLIAMNDGLSEGHKSFHAGLNEYTGGVSRLYNGANDLAANGSTVKDGADRLADGTRAFGEGTGALADGGRRIMDGTGELRDGTSTMAEKLKEASDMMVDYSFDDKNAEAFTQPTELKREEISVVVNNGHAMAPYMMTISLFVGALALAIVYPFTRGREKMTNGLRWWTSKAMVVLVSALLQGIIMVASLMLIVGLSPQYTQATVVMAIVTAFTFGSIVVFLTLNYGLVGKFLTVVLLVLQLATSEGTYPLVLSRGFYGVLSPFLPATYAIRGFKEAISRDGHIGQYVAILLGFALVFNLLNVLVQIKFRKGKLKRREAISRRIRQNIE